MDCFYAAVEMRDNPTLKNKPIAVGGGNKRGVVATCNYEARKFGVHSAMSGDNARNRCPQIIFLPVNMPKYKEASQIIRSVMREITPLVEPLSLDEAYLDVTDCKIYDNSATYIAHHLKEEIYARTSLTASAGVAANKFLAKVASDWNKPNGIKVVPPDEVADFVRVLPVGKIPGVGKVTQKKLAALGIKTCADVQKYDIEYLKQKFGKFGSMLYERSFGIDERQVTTERISKSLSVESTFTDDINDDSLCHAHLQKLLAELERRLEKSKEKTRIKGMFVKVKFADFIITTKQSSGTDISLSKIIDVYQEARSRRSKPIRLLGLGVYFASEQDAKQNTKQNTKNDSPFLQLNMM